MILSLYQNIEIYLIMLRFPLIWLKGVGEEFTNFITDLKWLKNGS